MTAALASTLIFSALHAPLPASEAGPGDAAIQPSLRVPLMLRMAGLPAPLSGLAPGVEACFPSNLSPQERQVILDLYAARNPTEFEPGVRYIAGGSAWRLNGLQIGPGVASRANLTFSFVTEGASYDGQPSELGARITGTFGAGNEDLGFEFMRQAFAAWRKYTGISYSEVGDDGAERVNDLPRTSLRGDIRVGGSPRGVPSFLANARYPNGGGDILFNTSYWDAGALASTANSYRYLRNVLAHELGHAVGHAHSVPCTNTKLMEPFIFTGQDMLLQDDIRAGQRNNGDRFAFNTDALGAQDFGDLTSRSILERDLSTNGVSALQGADRDWFRFTLTAARTVTITAQPRGASFSNGAQSTDCNSDLLSTVDSLRAGNLAVTLYNSDGTAQIATASSAAAGNAETINAGTLQPGTYTVRVIDQGPNSTVNQFVQLYDLTIRVNSFRAPPQAIAGVNKRVRANTTCFFIGDINSRVQDTTGSLANSGYDWDLDGDGVYETLGNPRPSRSYISNGVYNVGLRLTDSSGGVDTDAITVTVFGASTVISTLNQNSGVQGTSVPVSITGVNFKGVTSASQVVISGSGVAASGTPVVNLLGTSITGLNFAIDAVATPGARDVTITNADGVGGDGILAGGFTVIADANAAGACCVNTSCAVLSSAACSPGVYQGNGSACGPIGNPTTCCPANYDLVGGLTPSDIFAFLNGYFSADPRADFNGDGVRTPTDIFAFLNAYFAGC